MIHDAETVDSSALLQSGLVLRLQHSEQRDHFNICEICRVVLHRGMPFSYLQRFKPLVFRRLGYFTIFGGYGQINHIFTDIFRMFYVFLTYRCFTPFSQNPHLRIF